VTEPKYIPKTEKEKVFKTLIDLEVAGVITKEMKPAEIMHILENRGFKFNVKRDVLRKYISEWKKGLIPKELIPYAIELKAMKGEPMYKQSITKPESKPEQKQASETKEEKQVVEKEEELTDEDIEEFAKVIDFSKDLEESPVEKPEDVSYTEDGGSDEDVKHEVRDIRYVPKRTVRATVLLDPRIYVLYNIITQHGINCTFDEFINASVLAFWKLKGFDIALLTSSQEGE